MMERLLSATSMAERTFGTIRHGITGRFMTLRLERYDLSGLISLLGDAHVKASPRRHTVSA